MSQTAKVIELAQVRRVRAERAASATNHEPQQGFGAAIPIAWMPFWFFMPVWIMPGVVSVRLDA